MVLVPNRTLVRSDPSGPVGDAVAQIVVVADLDSASRNDVADICMLIIFSPSETIVPLADIAEKWVVVLLVGAHV